MTKSELLYKAKAEMERLKEETKTLLLDIFQDKCEVIFARFPDVEAFRWSQYTPSFNDGDIIEFRCYFDCPEVLYKKDVGPRLFDDKGEADDNFTSEFADSSNQDGFGWQLEREFSEFVEEDFLLMFEDCKQITVSRSGIDIEDCQYDD